MYTGYLPQAIYDTDFVGIIKLHKIRKAMYMVDHFDHIKLHKNGCTRMDTAESSMASM